MPTRQASSLPAESAKLADIQENEIRINVRAHLCSDVTP